jgi:hypothetical protein
MDEELRDWLEEQRRQYQLRLEGKKWYVCVVNAPFTPFASQIQFHLIPFDLT